MSVIWLPSAIIGTACALALFVLVRCKALVRSRDRVHETWSAVGVHLRQRANLICHLVEVVGGCEAQERRIFDRIARARTALQHVNGAADAGPANDMMTTALRRALEVAEHHPQPRPSRGFKTLRNDICDTEEQIAFACRRYNGNVLDYNTRIETYPEAFFAHAFNFMPYELFEVSEERGVQREARSVPALCQVSIVN